MRRDERCDEHASDARAVSVVPTAAPRFAASKLLRRDAIFVHGGINRVPRTERSDTTDTGHDFGALGLESEYLGVGGLGSLP